MIFTEFEHNDNWKIKRFPCSCCLVKPACNDYAKCELLNHNSKKIFNLIQNEKKCPDCGITLHKVSTDVPILEYNFRCSDCEHLFRISYKFKMALRGK